MTTAVIKHQNICGTIYLETIDDELLKTFIEEFSEVGIDLPWQVYSVERKKPLFSERLVLAKRLYKD